MSKKYSFDKFNFNIQINQYQPNPYQNTNIRLSQNGANYLIPLLEKQDYINEVTKFEDISKLKNCFNLDNFRKLPLNTMAGHIPNYYYHLFNGYLERHFDKKILNVQKNNIFKNKVIIFYSKRYRNAYVNLKVLEKFKEKLVFIGLLDQYQDFCKLFFNVQYYKVKSALQLAEILSGCKFVISNQNGNFSLAECLKVPRILISPDVIQLQNRCQFGPFNNCCQGGTFDFAITTQKLLSLTQEFLI